MVHFTDTANTATIEDDDNPSLTAGDTVHCPHKSCTIEHDAKVVVAGVIVTKVIYSDRLFHEWEPTETLERKTPCENSS